MPTLRLAMDMAYELIGWPAQFSGVKLLRALYSEIRSHPAATCRGWWIICSGLGLRAQREAWQEPLPPAVEGEAA